MFAENTLLAKHARAAIWWRKRLRNFLRTAILFKNPVFIGLESDLDFVLDHIGEQYECPLF